MQDLNLSGERDKFPFVKLFEIAVNCVGKVTHIDFGLIELEPTLFPCLAFVLNSQKRIDEKYTQCWQQINKRNKGEDIPKLHLHMRNRDRIFTCSVVARPQLFYLQRYACSLELNQSLSWEYISPILPCVQNPQALQKTS